jgi:site-specific recombinase XerD
MEQTLSLYEPNGVAEQTFDLCHLAEAFIASRDVARASRMTYKRALKAFFDWLSASGRADRINKLTRFDILAYKEELGRTKSPDRWQLREGRH